jgi:cell division protein FtsB
MIVAQVVAFVGLILAAYFIVGFARVTLAGYRMRALKAELETQVAELQDDIAALQEQLEYVQTDEYVEQAAREELKLTRPGDHVVVPLFRGEIVSPEVDRTSFTEPDRTQPPWRAWWALFFDR